MLWLATRVGKMVLCFPLGITRFVRKKMVFVFHIIKPLSTRHCSEKMAQYWLCSFFFFCVIINLDSVSVHKHAKRELGQYPHILISRLVNHPIYHATVWTVLCDDSNNGCQLKAYSRSRLMKKVPEVQSVSKCVHC